MNRILRTAGLAAAAVALGAAATFSAPSQAEERRGAEVVMSLKGESPASIDAALDGVEAQVATPEARAEETGFVAMLWNAAASLFTAPTAPPPQPERPRTLDELVVAYASADAPDREQDCLASAVYFEARGEPIEGQLAVAEVVLNRAVSGKYPRDICGVVEQPWQFSFVNATGRIPNADRGSDAWKKSVAIAQIARAELADSLPSNVLWYHADYVDPSWGKRLSKQTKIGLHIFYS